MPVPVDLGSVEATIRSVETETHWRIPPAARTTINQLFVSLATDEGGYEVLMTDKARNAALSIAQAGLSVFLHQVVIKSQEVAGRSKYAGKEVGFPVVVREMDGWAQRIKCHCWPR